MQKKAVHFSLCMELSLFDVKLVFQALKDINSLYGHCISRTVADRQNVKSVLESLAMISYSCSIHLYCLRCLFRREFGFKENFLIWSLAGKLSTAELRSKKTELSS